MRLILIDADGRQHKAEDQQVKPVHGVPVTEASMAYRASRDFFFSVITDMNLYLCGEFGGPIARGGARHQIKTAAGLGRAKFGL